MDAFSVSICKGLTTPKISLKYMITIGIYFGIFQGVMPIIGFLLGIKFQKIITPIDHWIVFILLLSIGLNMIKETFTNNRLQTSSDIKPKEMIMLSIATSIDALAIGITLVFLDVNIIKSSVLIGIITFILSTIGVKIGNIFGNKYEKKAQLIGGVILILLGFKVLFEHLLS